MGKNGSQNFFLLNFPKVLIFIFQCLKYNFSNFLVISLPKIKPNLTIFLCFLSFNLPYLFAFQIQKSPQCIASFFVSWVTKNSGMMLATFSGTNFYHIGSKKRRLPHLVTPISTIQYKKKLPTFSGADFYHILQKEVYHIQ